MEGTGRRARVAGLSELEPGAECCQEGGRFPQGSGWECQEFRVYSRRKAKPMEGSN